MTARRLVLASNNKGKLAELDRLLSPLGIHPTPQGEHDVPEADEPAVTFVENALLKARNAARHTGLPALADDSGLSVDALGGAPGVRSARYAGPGASDRDNIDQLLARLTDVDDGHRSAQFHCVLVYLRHADDPTPLICHGIWRGHILQEVRGEGGFGYDPVFWVPDAGCTAAELEAETKARISHRGQALEGLLDRLAHQLGGHD
ncbi:XTP/dITP diphosphohydrolase [Tamilnaduibacter salinus]|uniref:dITP/XTP pyrophosphatase n=1 Tax=Tamilnaduibacter salinus TaxID=1484056 RepID=A0A2A2I145_9GAMM|nr:RdgB/HAM1 family non-canonical purine NTP pyrophosphatase [Tamilnaduibacter salinus]PAV25449.1 non-canonical purine NTP pyrophosphatase, RdgB/HAM1 family [Tamilnaduibacter salinus]PVY76964.1 XTP/dITP diphosphohydrolase [Tamilnaduibacter salinus]